MQIPQHWTDYELLATGDVNKLEQQMQIEVENLNFEKAAELRDEINELQEKLGK